MEKNISETFSYLAKKLLPDASTREIISPVIKKLVKGDLANKTEFGFSLKLKKGKIEDTLRLVNYDTYSKNFENLYTERIELIEGIINSYGKSNVSKLLFHKLRKLNKIKPSLYFGLETKKKKIRFKVYLHFGDINDSKTVRSAVKSILEQFKINIPLKKEKIVIMGFDIDQEPKPKYKIYYLTHFLEEKCQDKGGPSSLERKIFTFLKPISSHYHFGERYQGNKLISRKFGVQLKNGLKKETLEKLLSLSGNTNCLREILTLIKSAKGKIHVIDAENDNLILYIRF